jgi:hypothetical protein
MSDLPTRHYTATGRIVYNRASKRFTWRDARRILEKLPDPTVEETQAYLDCYNLINSRLRYQVGVFDKDLVKEFFNTLIRSLFSLLQNSWIYQLVKNKLGSRLITLIEIIADALI